MNNAMLRLVREDGPAGPMRFNFTKKQLERIEPGDRQRWAYDQRTPGLAMLTTPGGAKTFYLAKRIEGRYRRVKIGAFPDITIEQARKVAARHVGDIAGGDNPAERRRRARAATTFGDLFAYYLEHHAKKHKRTWEQDQSQYDRRLKRWAGRRLDQITRQDVAALHGRIGKSAPVAANRVLALLSKLYSVAAETGYEGVNPAKGVKRFSERQRGRFLDADELPRFMEAVEAEPNRVFRDYFKMLLFTGQRRRNVASMEWKEIDMRRKVWTIPGEKFKTGSPVQVPLVPAAVEILERRKRENAEREEPSGHVFPSRSKRGKSPHMAAPNRPLDRICEEAGITGLHVHDLRRTVASWATMQGVPYPVVARMVGHKPQGVTSIYARFDLDAVRDGFERAVNAMLDAAGVESDHGGKPVE